MALFTGIEPVWRVLPRGRDGWGSVVQTGEHCGLWVDGFSGIAGRREFGDKPPTSPEEGDYGVNRQRVLAKRYCRSHMFERRMESRRNVPRWTEKRSAFEMVRTASFTRLPHSCPIGPQRRDCV
jgi:hypothetical protein